MFQKGRYYIGCIMVASILLTGCANADIEPESTDNEAYLDALDENATESLFNTEIQNNTENTEILSDAESGYEYNAGNIKSFSTSHSACIYGPSMNEITDYITIESGDNHIYAGTQSNLYDALGISEVTVRLYLLDNDHLIEFAVEEGETALYQEIVIEDSDYSGSDDLIFTQLTYDSSQILSSSGLLSVVCIYYPEGIPEMGLGSYIATSVYSVAYKNSLAEGVNLQTNSYIGSTDIKLSKLSTEWGDSDSKYSVTDIGPAMEFSEQSTSFYHYGQDLTWDGEETRYLSFYYQNSPGEYVLGLICDGEFVKLDGDNYFIRAVQTEEDDKVLCYDITDLVTLDEGLHYMQVIVIEISSDKDVMECYRVETDRFRIAAE